MWPESVLKAFKEKLCALPVPEGCARIPEASLQRADVWDLGELLFSCYGQDYGQEVLEQLMKAVDHEVLPDAPLLRAREDLHPVRFDHLGVRFGLADRDQNSIQIPGCSEMQSDSPLFAEEGRSGKMEEPADSGGSFMCSLCPVENLPEKIRPEVISDSKASHETYRLCFTEAGSFLCSYTDLIFEVSGAVTITYHFDSWPNDLSVWGPWKLLVAGPLLNIQADPVEAVAVVHFPHCLCLAGEDSSEVHIAHFVKEGMTLEKPDRVGPFHAVWKNPSFSSCGVIYKKSWFKRNIKVHAVALLYQELEVSVPKFHLYLLPNVSSVRKAVHKYEVTCPSRRLPKPSWTNRPLKIGSRFFVQELDDVTVYPEELEFIHADADKEQPYLELYAEHIRDTFEFNVMQKDKSKPVWVAHVRQEELRSPALLRIKETSPSVLLDLHFIDCHREQLIKRTANVEGVLDMLLGPNLDEEQYQKISSRGSNPEKMRELYMLVPSWNNTCKDQLYNALKAKNPHLIDDLEGRLTPKKARGLRPPETLGDYTPGKGYPQTEENLSEDSPPESGGSSEEKEAWPSVAGAPLAVAGRRQRNRTLPAASRSARSLAFCWASVGETFPGWGRGAMAKAPPGEGSFRVLGPSLPHSRLWPYNAHQSLLAYTLARLKDDELRAFKGRLLAEKGASRIPEALLEEVDAWALGHLLVSYYGEGRAVEVTAEGLKAVGCKLQAEALLRRARQVTAQRRRTASTADSGDGVVCLWCPSEDLPEKIRPDVVWDSQSHEIYRLCSLKAGSFHCCYTDLIFEVIADVTITYHFDSWSKHRHGWDAWKLFVAGPLLNIQADPVEAVAAVHFPHFLCLAGEDRSRVHLAHFVEEGVSLDVPDRVGPFHAVLRNPKFSLRGVVFKKSWFKRKIKVHSVALLYQVLQIPTQKFHLYLLPNDSSLRKIVHEKEVKCPSWKVEKPSAIPKPLMIGSRFFLRKLDDVTVCPKELELQYLDADMEQQYLELYAEQVHDKFNLNLVEKSKDELVWEAYVRREELQSSAQGASGCIETSALSISTASGTCEAYLSHQMSVSSELHFIDRHREQLIQRTTNVEGLLDMLLDIILNNEQYQKISSKETNPEKMRELYMLVPSWDNACKDLLYKVLKTRLPYLIADLEGQTSYSVCAAGSPRKRHGAQKRLLLAQRHEEGSGKRKAGPGAFSLFGLRPRLPPARSTNHSRCRLAVPSCSLTSSDSSCSSAVSAMPKTIRDRLLDTLENLDEGELRKFKAKLNEIPVKKGYDNIPRGRLQKADALDLIDLLIAFYTEDYAVRLTAEVLEAINCKDQAAKLLEATGNGLQFPSCPGMHFIEQHREDLIQRTTLVESVLDRLYGPVLNGEQYQKVCAKDTNPEKMRELYKLVPSWNRFCKDKLYEALKAKNPHLVDDLEGR
ncbi:uncharacterized protein LOC133367497 [Rhineura floridana]|uniref:uncharacterized protein LOC133367497 n=1 Tax=Rhineura floridana TaxID=261503 RepID=UPI002AC824CB|nr:uncharacterized protein LOC133367497 [Rhineura floridana]